MEVTIKAVGVKPLLLHNVDLANPLNPWAREMTELRRTTSKNRTEAWHEKMAHANFMGAFYTAPNIKGIAIPAENLRRSVVGAAKASRLGTTVERAMLCLDDFVPLVFDGPSTPTALWENGKFQITRMIRGSSGASPTTYPMFADWMVAVTFDLDDTILNLRDLRQVADRAGRIEGLGASRKQGYGRFTAVVEARAAEAS